MASDDNGRTHEPSLREVTAELDGLRALALAKIDAMREIAEERDVRYSQRFSAQQEALTQALSAAEKAVASALLAADRAVSKAELAAEKRFESVNEFRGALSDQTNRLLPRTEADARFSTYDEKIERIDKAQQLAAGRGLGSAAAWSVALGIFGLLGVLASVVYVGVRIATGH